MAKSAVEARATKEAAVEEIREKLGEAEAAVLTGYRGLGVAALAELRAALRPTDTEYKVFKNTLTRRAVEQAGATDLIRFLEGPTAIAFVKGDIAAAAKAMRDFARGHDAFVVKGGLLGDQAVTPEEIGALADLPSREVLLSQVAGLFEAPLAQVASLLEAGARDALYAVQALIDKTESAESE